MDTRDFGKTLAYNYQMTTPSILNGRSDLVFPFTIINNIYDNNGKKLSNVLYNIGVLQRSSNKTGIMTDWSIKENSLYRVGYYSMSLGLNNMVSGDVSLSIGSENKVYGKGSFVSGLNNSSSANLSLIHGYNNISNTFCCSLLGAHLTSNNKHQLVCGIGNRVVDKNSELDPTLFVIGNGDYLGNDIYNKSNIVRVTKNEVFVNGQLNAVNYGYGEYFKWVDGTTTTSTGVNNEYKFVVLDGNSIAIYDTGVDTFEDIIGVTTYACAVVGNSPDDYDNRWVHYTSGDVMHHPEYTLNTTPDKVCKFDYDNGIEYLKMKDSLNSTTSSVVRIEKNDFQNTGVDGYYANNNYCKVVLKGRCYVKHDDSFVVGDRCKSGVGGIATKSLDSNGFKVLWKSTDSALILL